MPRLPFAPRWPSRRGRGHPRSRRHPRRRGGRLPAAPPRRGGIGRIPVAPPLPLARHPVASRFLRFVAGWLPDQLKPKSYNGDDGDGGNNGGGGNNDNDNDDNDGDGGNNDNGDADDVGIVNQWAAIIWDMSQIIRGALVPSY